MLKAKNIICGKEIKVEIINNNYGENMVEVKIIEGKFKGQYAIINITDMVEYQLNLMEQTQELLSQMNVNFQIIAEEMIAVTGIDYDVYITLDEESKEFDLETLNLNVEYDDDDNKYKNKVTRKRLSAVKTYIETYID